MNIPKIKNRDFREEVREIMARELILPAAIARECGLAPETFDAWMAGSRQPFNFVARVGDFLDDRATVWRAIGEASNETRQAFACRLIANIAALSEEMAAVGRDARAQLRDHLSMYLLDLRRLVALMASDDARTAQRFARALENALAPGDRLLIARGGGADRRNGNDLNAADRP